MTAAAIQKELRNKIRKDKADFLPGFFKAFPGGYGEGDQFLGVVVPDQRKIAKQFRDLSLVEIKKLLQSKWHECRLTGFFILVTQFESAFQGRKADPERTKVLLDFYLDHLSAANNWDIVDATAPKILGPWIVEHPEDKAIVQRLSKSKVMWEQRVAVLANFSLIRDGDFDLILALSESFLNHPHDLMHKAVGWMLREVGKRNENLLKAFLEANWDRMPRTMLRYAIEKLPEPERKQWVQRGK